MAVVKVNGIERSYPEGTTYLEIARDFQDQYENDILLVRVNGKLRELEKTLAGDSEISFITAKENAGYKTYERSAIFLMLKAFYEVVPKGISKATGIEKVCEMLLIDKEDTIGFGDSANDVSMLACVNTSVAMGSGNPILFDKVTLVTDGVMEDGIAHAIEKLGLLD